MRVALILAVLLIAAANAVAVVSAGETIRPYLSGASIALAILAFVGLLLQRRQRAFTRKPEAEPVRPEPASPRIDQANAEIVAFMAMLQEKGRLVDFLMDDINSYSDAQVGAAARVVHTGCKGVLKEHFGIRPIRTEQEGSTVQVPSGYSADQYRFVGKITGQAPFSGVLVHRGWMTDTVKLPQLLHTAATQLPAIAPAEVELK